MAFHASCSVKGMSVIGEERTNRWHKYRRLFTI